MDKDDKNDKGERVVVIAPINPPRRESTQMKIQSIGEEFREARNPFRNAAAALRRIPRKIAGGIRRLTSPTDKK
jgi:hypothetical protein